MSYLPPGSTTQSAGLVHQQGVVYYERRSLDRLEAFFRFGQIGQMHALPLNSGKTIQMKRYTLPGFNSQPSAEGVTPAPVGQISTTVTAIVDEYSDWMSSSTLLNLTDISDTVTAMVDDLSYRAAGSVDTIIRAEIDAQTTPQVSSLGSYATAADFKFYVGKLRGINVRPFDGPGGQPQGGGNFRSVIHPYITYDLISDNTAGGFIESLKYQSGNQVLQGEVGMVGNCRLLESTNVGSTGSAPNVLYYSYIFGAGGIGIIDLAGRGPDLMIDDARNKRFKLRVVPGTVGTADPTGEVGTIVSYWFAFAVKTLDSTNYRWYAVKHDASLV